MISRSFIRQNEKAFKIALIWIVLMAVIGLIYFIIALPVQLKVSKAQDRIAAKTDQARDMVEYINQENLDRLKKSRQDLKHRLGTFVSNADMVNESIYAISSIAEQVGVKDFTTRQESFDGFKPIANCQMLAAANVQVKCRGNYFQFLKLVNAYERFRPVILIDRFSFRNDGSKYLAIKMSLTILVNNASVNLI